MPVDDLLEPRRDSQDAERLAARYVTHALGKGLRTISAFDIELDHRGVVYKAFWLLRCDGSAVLLDSATGELHLLTNQ